jgi:mRNA interferase MazF
MTCRRGDIVLVLFPDSNLRTSKRRPALVVQSDSLGAELPQTMVAMITSNIVTDNLATIRYSEIDRVIASFAGMSEVDAALRTTLAL